jgi:hypothetical protein
VEWKAEHRGYEETSCIYYEERLVTKHRYQKSKAEKRVFTLEVSETGKNMEKRGDRKHTGKGKATR